MLNQILKTLININIKLNSQDKLFILFKGFGIFIYIIIFLFACREKENNRFQYPSIVLDNYPQNEDQKINTILYVGDSVSIFELNAEVSYRGSSSRKYPKKSFNIDFEENRDKQIDWHGLKLRGDWVLYAPYADRTCIRNALAQELFSRMGHSSLKNIFIELNFDTAYQGIYELRKKIKLSSNSVDSARYILKFDKLTGKKREYFKSSLDSSVPVLLHDVLKKDSTGTAFAVVREFEKNLQDPTDYWLKQVDLSSFVDYFLLSELANSPDAYRSSTYFQILHDSRIRMGPVWDFDLAFGNSSLYNAKEYKGWRFLQSEKKIGPYTVAPPWWSLLFEKEVFRSSLKKRWLSLRQGFISDNAIDHMIDIISGSIEPIVERNFSKWPVINKSVMWSPPNASIYKGELEYLKTWIHLRAKWMDEAL